MIRTPAWLALTLVLLGLPVLGLAVTVPAFADAPCQKTYTSVINQDIQTGAADTTVVIDVPDTEMVADVDFMVDISHPVDEDVSVVAYRDEGLARTLVDGRGGDGDDFDHTVFDDEAETHINSGSAPFLDSYVPLQSIDVWDGLTAFGHWKLLVKEAHLNTGDVFRSWGLTLTFETCDFDEDGVEDHTDLCPGLAGETLSGCPLTDRTLSLGYRTAAGKFAGRLESPLVGCRAARPVVVWRVRDGADAKVGRATTAKDGRWSLAREPRKGTYYASSARVVVPGEGECSATTSDRLRLR